MNFKKNIIQIAAGLLLTLSTLSITAMQQQDIAKYIEAYKQELDKSPQSEVVQKIISLLNTLNSSSPNYVQDAHKALLQVYILASQNPQTPIAPWSIHEPALQVISFDITTLQSTIPYLLALMQKLEGLLVSAPVARKPQPAMISPTPAVRQKPVTAKPQPVPIVRQPIVTPVKPLPIPPAPRVQPTPPAPAITKQPPVITPPARVQEDPRLKMAVENYLEPLLEELKKSIKGTDLGFILDALNDSIQQAEEHRYTLDYIPTLTEILQDIKALTTDKDFKNIALTPTTLKDPLTQSHTLKKVSDIAAYLNAVIQFLATPAAPTIPAIVKEPPVPAMPKVPTPQPLGKYPIGLVNVGASCFMNAAIQCMYAMTDVTNALLQNADQYKPNTLASEYINVTRLMRQSQRGTPLTPTTLCTRGWNAINRAIGTQQDAHEFTAALLEHLSSDLKAQDQYGRALYNISPLWMLDIDQELKEIGTNIIMKKEVMRNNPFLTLYATAQDTSIYHCLNAFIQPEKVEFRNKVSLQQLRIAHAGKYLIIQLNPVADKYEKAQIPLAFPLALDINPYAVRPQALYELIGCVMHSGSTAGGHYTSFVKHGNQWYFCDDSGIREASLAEMTAISERGYGVHETHLPSMFFYQQK